MNLEEKIKKAIDFEANKLILRYHAYHNRVHKEYQRKKIIDSSLEKKLIQPDYWANNKGFNPFYVKKNSKCISYSIAKKIANNTYKPKAPIAKEIPKLNNGKRLISIYEIPDAAISKMYYKRLLAKNIHRFSAFSYAYRYDKNVHFAIQDISIDICQDKRIFIAEFDFSNFFGSISHDYLKDQYNKNGFYISDEEKFIINSFLENTSCGIPQGTSISLFLANLVCWKLDANFQKEGLKFARYADDTIIWSPDYKKICRAFNIINEFSLDTKININIEKSEGISILTRKGLPSEFKSKNNINFLGYSISVDNISIKHDSINKIKKQISYLLYKNLIQPLKGKILKNITIPANNKDKDLLTAIMQINRYMYGGLNNNILKDYINGRTKRIYFKGIMSFYPLVNDETQLKSLDGWMTAIIYRIIRLRFKLLKNRGFDCSNTFPFNVQSKNIIRAFKTQKIDGKFLLEIPSFMLIYEVLKKGLNSYGISKVMNKKFLNYDY